ncbi:MAG TPA: SDR family oxidoreductase [Caldilineae bacterium]|nr:SDR family oxidoreductase [Caldilineae bacterium]
MPDFSDKTVIITGASTGIGRATAIAFHDAGARLVLAARSSDILAQLSTDLGGPDRALPVTTDVSDPDQCQALIERAVAQFGGVDVLINNAGMVVSGRFEHLQPDDIERQFAVNFFGVVYCTRAALPYLKQSQGVIVNISSVAGFLGTPTASAYSASKAALNSLGQSLRAELKPYGIGVSTVCPYFTSGAQLAQKGVIREGSLHKSERKQHKWQRHPPGQQTSEQVAAAILKAAERRPRLVVLSPVGRLIWRFNRLAPWLTHWLLERGVDRL